MANPTTNYSFAMPQNADLVKDLPADFEVFGQAVDTKLKALNPSTTLGDIEYRSATADTNTRLGIGSTGQVLAVSGGVPAWTTPSGSTANIAQIATGTLSGASVTISSLSAYDQLFIQLTNVYMSTGTGMSVLINNNTGAANYSWNGFSINIDAVSATKQVVTRAGWMPFYQNNMPSSSPDNTTGFSITNCKAAGFTNAYWSSFYLANTAQRVSESGQGRYLVAEAVSSLVLAANAGTFSGGTYTIWGG